MKRDIAQAAAEFTAAMTGARLPLHYGPGPHSDGSPQTIHAGGAKPAAKPPAGQMAFAFDKPAQRTARAKITPKPKPARPAKSPPARTGAAEPENLPAGGDSDHPAVLAFVGQYANARKEYTMAITKDGKPTRPVPGSEEQVRLPQEFVDARVVIHNHPDSSGFSPGDVKHAVFWHIGDLRITSPEFSYQLKAPPGGYPERWGPSKLKMRYDTYFEELLPKYLESDLSLQKQMQGISHEVMQRVAADFGLEYTRKPRPQGGSAKP